MMKKNMKTIIFLLLFALLITSCGVDSSPEKRMNIKNQQLEQRVTAIEQQQQILRDSIYYLNKKLQTEKK